MSELRRAVSAVTTEGTVDSESYWSYVRAAAQAAFLFGTDVTSYLEIVRAAMVRHNAQRGPLQSGDDAVRDRAADAEAEAFGVIVGFYERFDRLVAPYMQMHQKLPT